MIATLRGKIADKTTEQVIIECGGVGYGINVPFEDFGALAEGQEAKLFIYEHIRENTHDLFGFRNLESKFLFEQLLSVNGVGPRMALAILSIANLQTVRQAIATGDTKFISQATGVGKRVAERVVVDLKDKVGLTSDDNATDFLTTSANPNDDAIQALVALGYSVQDAAAALKKVDTDLPLEDRVKQALKS
jgi:Holliday junction DNA helicase RuvA